MVICSHVFRILANTSLQQTSKQPVKAASGSMGPGSTRGDSPSLSTGQADVQNVAGKEDVRATSVTGRYVVTDFCFSLFFLPG